MIPASVGAPQKTDQETNFQTWKIENLRTDLFL